MLRRRHRRVKATVNRIRSRFAARYDLPLDLNQSTGERLKQFGRLPVQSGVTMRSGAILPASFVAAALALAVWPPRPRRPSSSTSTKRTQSMTVTVDGAPRYTGRSRPAAGLRHAERRLQAEPHGRRPFVAGMGQCADAAHDLFRSARPRHSRLFQYQPSRACRRRTAA